MGSRRSGGSCGRVSRDRIVVSTSRCGRDNPGSNPGHGSGSYFGVASFVLLRKIRFVPLTGKSRQKGSPAETRDRTGDIVCKKSGHVDHLMESDSDV